MYLSVVQLFDLLIFLHLHNVYHCFMVNKGFSKLFV